MLHLPSDRGSISQAIRKGVHAGMTNHQIIAANPKLNPRTVQRIACAARKGALPSQNRGGPGLHIPQDIHDVLTMEARARYGAQASGHQLVLQILGLIVKDNLFDAIMDDPSSQKAA